MSEATALTAIPVELKGVKWTLYRGDSEPMIRDLDWAERLGYERPRTIRTLVKAMASDGRLGQVCCRRQQTTGSDGGRPAEEFFLTKGQALKVAAKSKTRFADELLDEMIQVFLLVLEGQPAAAPAPLQSEDPLALILRQSEQVGALARGMIEGRAAMQRLDAAQTELARAQAMQGLQVSETSAKVNQLLANQQAAALELKTPRARVLALPAISRRTEVNRLVRSHCWATGEKHQPTWNKIYRAVRDHYQIDIKARAEHKKISPLDLVEEQDLWDHVFAACDRYLTTQAAGNA